MPKVSQTTCSRKMQSGGAYSRNGGCMTGAKHTVLVVLLLSTVLDGPASAVEFDFSGSARGRLAIGTDEPELQSTELTLMPEVVSRFDNGWKLTSIGRLRTELVDGLRPGNLDRKTYGPASRPGLLRQEVEVELREFHLQGAWGETYLTLGKQQVVWGKADGLKVLDVVNPQSFREFILEDFDKSRIPLWTVNIERSVGNWDAQLIWIPDHTYHALPDRDATYAFSSPRLVPSAPPGVSVDIRSVDRPDRFLMDSDAGLRLSTFWKGWDISLNYLYQYDNFPVLFQRLDVRPTGPVVVIEPRFERTHVIGGTFSNAFGDWVVRGELGFFSDRFFRTNETADRDGITKSSELSGVLGLDWTGIEDTFLSAQLFQSWVTAPSAGLVRDELDTNLTFLVRRDFFNDTLRAEVLWIVNTNDGDGLIRPKIAYEWQDNLKTWVGADIFYGDRDGLFGQFGNNDRVILGVEWGY
ncbi:MAG: hypothetical protein OEY77_00650 [Nitrospira sp.]|nr:hypothetical protein [Nitrospira sp.]